MSILNGLTEKILFRLVLYPIRLWLREREELILLLCCDLPTLKDFLRCRDLLPCRDLLHGRDLLLR